MTVDDIIKIFNDEFSCVSNKFVFIKLLEGKRKVDINELSRLKLPSDNEDFVSKPGVYVFFAFGKPYKVGRNLTNSRKRALEHLRDNTGNGKIWEIKDADDREILLLNVKNEKDSHWVAAVEVYLEKELRKHGLVIKSKRIG